MTAPTTLDGLLVQWGDRLFYPGNRIVRSPPPVHGGAGLHDRARAIRARLHATVVRGAPQVMVKVTGGGRGMAAIAAHLRYISKHGGLPIEDDRGVAHEGKEGVHDLVEQWRHAGARIAERSPRREAFNIMLSMPAGTPAHGLQEAVRAFARTELWNHRYVMVLHTHQANPHIHLAVRAEGKDGRRLNRARPTCDAGGRSSPRSCGSVASKPKPRRRSRVAAAGAPSGSGTARPATRGAIAGRTWASRHRSS